MNTNSDVAPILIALSILSTTLYITFWAGNPKTMTSLYYGDNTNTAVFHTLGTQNNPPVTTATAAGIDPSVKLQEEGGFFGTLNSWKNDPTIQMVAGSATDMVKATPTFQLAVNAAKLTNAVANKLPTDQIVNNGAVQAVVNNQAVQSVVQSAPVKTLGSVFSPIAGFATGAYQGLLNEKGNPLLETALGLVDKSTNVNDMITNAIKATPQYQAAVNAAAQALEYGQTVSEYVPTDTTNQILNSVNVQGLFQNDALKGITQSDSYKFVSQFVDPTKISQMVMEDAKKLNAAKKA